MPTNGLLLGVVIGVAGSWAFHKYVRPVRGKGQ
jgi:hypothetical protein